MTTRLLRTAPGFASSEQTITKAKKPLTITAKEIEVEGTEENKIPEADLKLPEVIKKLTTQTIEAEKKFETPTPAEVGTSPGTTSIIPIVVKSGKGGNTSIVTTGTGGQSGKLVFATGGGGEAPSALTKATGGASGEIRFEIGPGANAKSAKVNVGGNAGSLKLNAGTGGAASAESETSNKGGSGSGVGFVSGGGGQAASSLGTNTGGESGAFTLATSVGGNASGPLGSKAIAGNSGVVTIETGPGGQATGEAEKTQGKGGEMRLVLGTGGGNTEANSSPFAIRYKETSGAIRFYIHPEGNVGIGNTSTPGAKLEVLGTGIYTGLLSAKAGFTVEGALTLPAESVVEAAYKKESVSKEKLTKGVQEELLKIETPTALGVYTNEKEEEEAKGTFVTAVVTIKAELAAATVKLINSGKEQEYKWDGATLGAQKFPVQLMVKKAGKWKLTYSGAVEKVEISRVTMEP